MRVWLASTTDCKAKVAFSGAKKRRRTLSARHPISFYSLHWLLILAVATEQRWVYFCRWERCVSGVRRAELAWLKTQTFAVVSESSTASNLDMRHGMHRGDISSYTLCKCVGRAWIDTGVTRVSWSIYYFELLLKPGPHQKLVYVNKAKMPLKSLSTALPFEFFHCLSANAGRAAANWIARDVRVNFQLALV